MELSELQKEHLRRLPGVDSILESAKADPFFDNIPRTLLIRAIRSVLETRRQKILQNVQEISEEYLSEQSIKASVKRFVEKTSALNLQRTINATGIVVHTNLGRSLLAEKAINNLIEISGRYSNLEFDLVKGKRGSRYAVVEDIICEISGAESAMVVNNNAGAVLLALETMANKREVIVSRGELVEIGGSFRIPDVMAKSGGILREVGTTNRTHLRDYENAINDQTALMLKVHKSNYSVVGFSTEVPLKDLVELGRKVDLPVMEDLGSGTFIDFSRYGMMKEPTVQESVNAGADIITFSGDKLLGGPQAGLIVGQKKYIDRIKRNPINRALRIDKMTLAAIEITLRYYRDPEKAVRKIPTLRMLLQPAVDLQEKANRLTKRLETIGSKDLTIRMLDLASKPGGGSMPMLELPSKCLGINVNGMSVNNIERTLRRHTPPIIGRIEENMYIMDMRTIQDDELEIIQYAFEKLLQKD
jgi:L-seryl-tRNA(Ser) seleniumtransferase